MESNYLTKKITQKKIPKFRYQTPKKEKRNDVQVLRGIAIITVLLFHFYPVAFPNGYAGVDLFFVISGFLMCMLLTKLSEKPIKEQFLNFYYRRMKRILPLYLLLLAANIIALPLFFSQEAYESNMESFEKAAIFASNVPKSSQQDYYELLRIAEDLFTHTWSLSVEIQTYIFLPFIFFIASFLDQNKQIYFHSLLGLTSLAYYFMIPPMVAFNSVLARYWQFSIGIISYLVTESLNETTKNYNIISDENQENGRKSTGRGMFNFLAIGVTLFLLMDSLPLNQNFVRILCTFGAGLIILSKSFHFLQDAKFFTYTGDISYSLYLVHWPICAYIKLNYDSQFSYMTFGLVTSVVLAIIITETFERWYIKNEKYFIPLIIGLYLIIFILYLPYHLNIDLYKSNNEIPEFNKFDNISKEEAIKINNWAEASDYSRLFNPLCKYDKPKNPYTLCEIKGNSTKNEVTMVVLGNSWVPNHSHMLCATCGSYVKKMVLLGGYGCEPLYPTRHEKHCKDRMKLYEKTMRDFKPDYAFIIARAVSLADGPTNNKTNISNIKDDEIYRFASERVKLYAKLTKKKLYIVDAIPQNEFKTIPIVNDALKKGLPLNDTALYCPNTWYSLARRRYAQLFEDCGDKCERIDYSPLFQLEDGSFRFVNHKNGLVYLNQQKHLTPHGHDKVASLYRDICKRF